MKQILMVAYHYPPEGGSSGVLRALKFSKYLPRHDWIPHILTLKASIYKMRDNELLRDIPPEAVVHRTFALDTAQHLSIRKRYPAFLSVPDRLVSWLPFGVAAGLRIIRKHNIRVLYSTSPLPTAHLIAGVLKSITRLPWMADFRDPWIEEGLHPRPHTIRCWIETGLERLVVHHSDRLILTTPRLRRDFLSRYPELTQSKVHVIYNGYDDSDFASLPDPTKSNRFEIIHAGLITPDFRDPLPLLRALSILISRGELPRHETKLTFVGGGSYTLTNNLLANVKELGLEDVVEINGRVSHSDALQRLRNAAVLLLMQASDDTKSLIPAKAFEYLRIGTPILALTPEGATADLLRGMEHCYITNPDDQCGLQHRVMYLYRMWKDSSERILVSRPISRYERTNLTSELSQILEELVDRLPRTYS